MLTAKCHSPYVKESGDVVGNFGKSELESDICFRLRIPGCSPHPWISDICSF